MLNFTQYADWIVAELAKAPHSDLVKVEKSASNRLTIQIKQGGHALRFRILFFAVGKAGRSNPLERRVEITSTYGGGLAALPGYVDVVFGVERVKRLLVGIDPRRLKHGGPTHNASTFVYLPSFDRLTVDDWFPLRTSTQLFESEYQIYLRPRFLVGYLKHYESFHKSGLVQLPSAPVKEDNIDDLNLKSHSGATTKLTYAQQLELALKKMQLGRLGESVVFEAEKNRLIGAGVAELADKVNWVSQVQPYLGYDIASSSVDDKFECVEVKSSVNAVRSFFFTVNEMSVAEARGNAYRLVCVSNVMTQPTFQEFRNPMRMIAEGVLAVKQDTSRVVIAK